MNTIKQLILLNIIFLVVISFFSCKKEHEKVMKVSNDSISEISNITAKANATIIDLGEGIEQHGHCWSTNAEPTIIENENLTDNGQINNTGTYNSILTALTPGTKYYVRAYVKNGQKVVYGAEILPFTTLSVGKPVVTTGTVTNITTSGAKVAGNLNSLGSGVSAVTQHGHCWSSATTTPIIEDNENKTSLGSKDTTGNYESSLVGLSAGTLYYIRAYAVNSAGTAYGDAVSFTTVQSSSIPIVITSAVSSVTATSAICGGSINSTGGSPITAKGVCWDTDLNPTTSNNSTNNGTGSDSFTSEITGLVENETYYVRAYATNSVGTAYGNHVSFTASDELSIPTVTTTAVSSETANTAVSGGNVTFDGGANVTARGVCWNTAGTPTISDDRTTDNSGTGVYTSDITGLTAGTLYYVRAYATNSVGTGYGDQVSFTTLEDTELPTVTTATITDITAYTAVSGGNVTSDGGATVSDRGVCWNTTGSPVITSDIYTKDGSGTGPFTSNITGLSPGITYYVRAYATNTIGTNYGNELPFTTEILGWQKLLGGSNGDDAMSIQQTTDGGYITAGHTYSSDGDVLVNHGDRDFWILKLTSTGNISWQKSLGGSDADRPYYIQQTTDGGYIIAGFSRSNDGDVSVNHGSADYWIVKLTATGNIDWQKTFGGTSLDYARSIQQTTDGGYIIAGYSSSKDVDITGNHGGIDYWILKLTSTGTLDWQKSLGGSNNDCAISIQQTTDGNYIIAGYSSSNDDDVSGNHGDKDYWIVKLTSTGNISWQKSLGGSGLDYARSIQQTTDGGYIVAGESSSNDGDVSGNHGNADYWIVKLTSTGNISWQKSLGGSNNDYAMSIRQTTEGGYIIAGYSSSNDDDVTGNHGDDDYWIVKLTSTGSLDWQKSLGGSASDEAYTIQQTDDGGYIFGGECRSNDGDVSGNHGSSDLWIVKLTSTGELNPE